MRRPILTALFLCLTTEASSITKEKFPPGFSDENYYSNSLGVKESESYSTLKLNSTKSLMVLVIG